VKYVDAGYAIALGALFLYAGWLIVRRRRLEAAVARQAVPDDRAATGLARADGPAVDPAPAVDGRGDGHR
jgi:hypothetical protein